MVIDPEPEVSAGDFTVWLAATQRVLRQADDAAVPCDGCIACCTASQFIHIGPDETDALAAIPPALLFPAPGLPPGHVLLGYDEAGRCPMLVDGACSIYASRPLTCRAYDCRVFAATGIEDAPEPVATRARRWRFAYSDASARAVHEELMDRARGLAGGTATQRAVRALTDLP